MLLLVFALLCASPLLPQISSQPPLPSLVKHPSLRFVPEVRSPKSKTSFREVDRVQFLTHRDIICCNTGLLLWVKINKSTLLMPV
uniref:Secreted protein n=1 Tax=Pyxicephalus adspersus TaxID=30357 RepID=A0AAV3AZ00_PYXAD|nr:TPA: hypothetical protein GDO54_006006 [Pyxicephalus adspersus]